MSEECRCGCAESPENVIRCRVCVCVCVCVRVRIRSHPSARQGRVCFQAHPGCQRRFLLAALGSLPCVPPAEPLVSSSPQEDPSRTSVTIPRSINPCAPSLGCLLSVRSRLQSLLHPDTWGGGHTRCERQEVGAGGPLKNLPQGERQKNYTGGGKGS